MRQRHMFGVVLLALGWAPLTAQEGAGTAKPAAPAGQDKDKEAAPTVLTVGSSVPADLRLTDADGNEFAFKEQRGKVVMLHFWSYDCPWEKVAEPKLKKLATDFKDKGVVVVAINANANEIGKQPDAEAFKAEKDDAKPYHGIRKHLGRLNHPVLFDHTGDVARLFGAESTPHCFVIDKEGKVAYGGALDHDGKSPDVDAEHQYARLAIEAALAGKPAATTSAKPYG